MSALYFDRFWLRFLLLVNLKYQYFLTFQFQCWIIQKTVTEFLLKNLRI